MNWKQKLGIQGEEEEEEEEEVEKDYIFSKEIDGHFLSLGFYEHTMNPRFMNSNEYDNLMHDEPVLRFDGDWDYHREGVQRVFMNQYEIYVERQTNYRSFDGSSYHKFETHPTSIEEIEELLEELVESHDSWSED